MRANGNPNGRVFRRARVRIPVQLLLSSRRNKVQHNASIVDLSVLGVRVQADIALKPRQAVEVIRMTGPCPSVPSRVVWVGEPGSGMEGQAGLRYLDPLHAHIAP